MRRGRAACQSVVEERATEWLRARVSTKAQRCFLLSRAQMRDYDVRNMGNRRLFSCVLGPVTWLFISLTGACGTSAKDAGGGVDAAPPPETFRVVIVTDTHIIGSQYTCCVENSDADNASIVKTTDRLKAARDAINAITPPPEAIFVMGDVVHAAHFSRNVEDYRTAPNAYSIARDIIKTFTVPVYMVMGNHDYEVDCGSSKTFDPQFSEDRFKEFFNQPPYQAVDLKGWKFMLVNSQRGPTFDVNDTRCATESASVGKEQIAWAEAQLAEGKPTIVMSHYMRLLYGDVEEGAHVSFPKLLDDHAANVKMFMAGHSHRWIDMSRFNNGVPHQLIGGTRYDPDNFALLELDSAGGFRIVDIDKAVAGTSCANTWSYDGDPKPVPGAPETGDCVSGL